MIVTTGKQEWLRIKFILFRPVDILTQPVHETDIHPSFEPNSKYTLILLLEKVDRSTGSNSMAPDSW